MHSRRLTDPVDPGTGRPPQHVRSGATLDVVDTRNEVREFLTSRRARIAPEQAGLRTYGSVPRRVPGLRREEVALLAGVSVDYYTRLERGNATSVSDTVLEGLAPGSKSEEALDLLVSWTATPDQEESDADHEEQPRHRSGA
jgi:transcriptional regulator with XRE-family HTH domain